MTVNAPLTFALQGLPALFAYQTTGSDTVLTASYTAPPTGRVAVVTGIDYFCGSLALEAQAGYSMASLGEIVIAHEAFTEITDLTSASFAWRGAIPCPPDEPFYARIQTIVSTTLGITIWGLVVPSGYGAFEV